jgi:hypothetical protein
MTDVTSVSRSISLLGRDAAVARDREKLRREEDARARAKWERERKELAESAELAQRALRTAFRGRYYVDFLITSDFEITWDGECGPSVAEVEAALDAAGIERREDEVDAESSVGDAR